LTIPRQHQKVYPGSRAALAARALNSALLLLLTAVSARAQPSPGVPYRTGGDGGAGVNFFRPGHWSSILATLVNPADHPADVLSTHSFSRDTGLQFARQLWLPPEARRTSWYPVLPSGPARGLSLPFQTLLIDRTRGTEVLLKDAGGALIHDGLLLSQPGDEPVTGVIAEANDEQTAVLAQVARAAQKLSRRVSTVDLERLPPAAESLGALDHIVIASDRLADAPGLGAVRRWLHAGGRAWVRLERVAPATVSLLLGEDFPCSVVDRVGLTRWHRRAERGAAGPDEALETSEQQLTRRQAADEEDERQLQRFEPPVDMVRVVAPGARPMHTIDGWPASFWRRAGRGWVLFTTVAPRGWIAPRPKGEPPPADDIVHGFQADESLRQLAFAFFKHRQGPPLAADAFRPLLLGQVGHQVIGRATVASILGGCCLVVAAGGWWLARRGDLAHLGWLGPATALAAALLLLVLGAVRHGQVPPTVAVAQLIEATPGVDEAPVSGLVALYTPAATSGPLGAERGGVFVPEQAAQRGTSRMVWTDLDRWHWENLTLSPGLHLAPLQTTAAVGALSCQVTFGPAGIRGSAELGPLHDPADALIAFPVGRHLAVELTGAAGSFAVGAGTVMAPGQFIASTLLTAEQQRRQAVLARLLDRQGEPRYPQRPTLLAWTSPIDLGFTFMEQARGTGSALVALPIDVARPPPGTHVLIPAPFLPYHCVFRRDFSFLYDSKKGTWLSRSRPGKTMLRFQVPPALLPLQVERATLHIDISAPGRPLEVFADVAEEVLATRASPVGKLRIDIERPDVLQPDAGGGVHLGLAVSGPPGRDEWRINELRLELAGRIAEE
jgi:hypothetical protein